jgi:hypothetical protein
MMHPPGHDHRASSVHACTLRARPRSALRAPFYLGGTSRAGAHVRTVALPLACWRPAHGAWCAP